MFCHLAAASLTLLIQSAVTTTPAPAPLTPPAAGTPPGSNNFTALGVVQLQPTTPGTQQVGNANVSGSILAGSFKGSGALLTALDAGAVTTGTLNDLRLSSNIARLASAQVFSGQKTFSSAPIFSAAGMPFSVASSTLVSNLNCDLLDGLSSSAFLQAIPVPLALNNPATDGNAIKGTANSGGSATGLWGEAADGVGVYGYSTNGFAIQAYGAAGAGIYAESSTGTAVYAANYNSGDALVGVASNGEGCSGLAFSAGKSGVRGYNGTIFGAGPGVTGESLNGSGVVGAGGTNGVQGNTSNSYTSGVYGENAGNGYGIAGRSLGGGGIGAYGESVYPGWGVYSAGDTYVSADLWVSGSKFGYVSDIVRNVGGEPLEVGTLVEIVGVSAPVLGEIPVIDVRKATIQHARAALGPIACALSVEPWSLPAPIAADGTTSAAREQPRFNMHRQAGAIAPGAFGGVVTLGSFATLNVDAEFGPVLPGDLLVASPNPGYAMVSMDPLPGTLIGKALGTLASGTGQIAVIIKGD